ncbi:MAG: TspO/MBR family protein [Flavobacteriaceae bacterium]
MRFALTFIVFLILNFSALSIGTLLMNNGPDSEWYTSLQQAPWTPVGWVFGAAWTCVMIFFSVYMTFLYQNLRANKVYILFCSQYILNVLWNFIFFNQKETFWGLIIILILLLLTFYFLIAFKTILKNYRLFVLPYCIWLLMAASLNLYIVIYN